MGFVPSIRWIKHSSHLLSREGSLNTNTNTPSMDGFANDSETRLFSATCTSTPHHTTPLLLLLLWCCLSCQAASISTTHRLSAEHVVVPPRFILRQQLQSRAKYVRSILVQDRALCACAHFTHPPPASVPLYTASPPPPSHGTLSISVCADPQCMGT